MNIKKTIPYKIIKELTTNIKYKTKSIYYKLRYHKIENKIIFSTFQGTYTCNPKAICEELIKENIPYKLVWAIDKKEDNINEYPKELSLVVKGSKEFYKELSTAKLLIENENTFGRRYCYKKRKGQIYLQTWHGSMGIKRMCVDRGLISRIMMKITKKYQSYVDYILSNSNFETNLYRNTYWPKANILEYGHPRNDILFKENKDIIQKVKNYFNIPKDNKIFLYAPTFREKNKDLKELNYLNILNSLKESFGGTWTILVRTHYNEKRTLKSNKLVIDATKYPDMQELLCASDIGLTDYSSWICDFVLTAKPGFLYTPDLEDYQNNERGFYYPLNKMPFPISITEEELINNIKNFDKEVYLKKRDTYLKEMGCLESGEATKKIIKKIKELLNA